MSQEKLADPSLSSQLHAACQAASGLNNYCHDILSFAHGTGLRPRYKLISRDKWPSICFGQTKQLERFLVDAEPTIRRCMELLDLTADSPVTIAGYHGVCTHHAVLEMARCFVVCANEYKQEHKATDFVDVVKTVSHYDRELVWLALAKERARADSLNVIRSNNPLQDTGFYSARQIATKYISKREKHAAFTTSLHRWRGRNPDQRGKGFRNVEEPHKRQNVPDWLYTPSCVLVTEIIETYCEK